MPTPCQYPSEHTRGCTLFHEVEKFPCVSINAWKKCYTVTHIVCLVLAASSIFHSLKWAQLNLYPNASDPLSDSTSEVSPQWMQQTIFKRQLTAFDAISGRVYRTGLKRRIARWLLVISNEFELWILEWEPCYLTLVTNWTTDVTVTYMQVSARAADWFYFSNLVVWIVLH